MKELPKIGETYNCFDDGKIKLSRLYTVIITDIIPFKKIDSEILKLWKQEVEDCYWLYAEETDYFILSENTDKSYYWRDKEIFVRTKNGGWFSIGGFMNCGELDVDGKLTEMLYDYY